ncbi:AAA family ATPase [Candidatus Woesearchaeota archaeon]|nr:AAA family ATPase [Candidatus Woesearchaeota archaeon]
MLYIMDYKIERGEAQQVEQGKHWLLLYGRRKVGKTFLLRNLCQFEHYYTVKKNGEILSEKGTISVATMMEEVKKLLKENKPVVIDEFQRLEETFLEELTLLHPKGKLVLSGSSLRIIKKIFEPKSPLLGFFTPLSIGFIKPSEMLLNKKLKTQIDLFPFLREPWTIPLYAEEDPLRFVYTLVIQSKLVITALIGEIFVEEERGLTNKYEAILGLIGSGIWNTKELTSLLYSRKLIPDPSPTHLIQYIKNLEEMGLVESIKLHKTKGNYYRLSSPLMNVYYYLESRYDIGSRDVSFEEMKPTLQKLIHLEIQNFIADLFAEIYHGRKEYFFSPEKEVDFIITVRNKPAIIGEVKWKKSSPEDIARFEQNAAAFSGRKVFICLEKTATAPGIEFFDPADLKKMALQYREL